jgi:hypothetical protein
MEKRAHWGLFQSVKVIAKRVWWGKGRRVNGYGMFTGRNTRQEKIRIRNLETNRKRLRDLSDNAI